MKQVADSQTKPKVSDRKVYVGSLADINEVELEENKTLLKAIASNGGIEFPEMANKQLVFLVRRGFPENESRFFLPIDFVRTSLGGKFKLQAGDLVLLTEKLKTSAFALGTSESGASFTVSGMVQRQGEYQTKKAVTKIEDILTESYSGSHTSDESHLDMIIYQTTASDGVLETYYLPLEEPFLEQLYLKVRIKNDDHIKFVCAKQELDK